MATNVGEAVIKLTFDGKDVKASLSKVESEVEKSDAEIMEQIKSEYKADKKFNLENRVAYKTFENEKSSFN